MDNFWNERYSSEEYVYGKEPNAFIKAGIDGMKPGKLLLPGEGEGRNAVYAAGVGWDVYAFDRSSEGKKKALQLAIEKNIELDYKVCSLLDYPLEKSYYDLIALGFFHLLPEARRFFHAMLINALKPGGRIVIEAFSKEQLGYETGGPRDLSLLYDLSEIENDFLPLETVYASREDTMLDEGPFHQGVTNVIRYIGKKI